MSTFFPIFTEGDRRASAALGAHRFLLRAGLAGSHVFAWIFVFVLFVNTSGNIGIGMKNVFFLYALSQVVNVLMTPVSARLLAVGARRMMCLAVLYLSLAYLSLGAVLGGFLGAYREYGIVAFAISMGIYQALYWIPYSVERETFPSHHKSFVSKEIFIALLPILSGIMLLSDPLAPIALMFSFVGLFLVSLLPLTHTPSVYEKFSWTFRESFGELIEPAHRRFVATSFYEGFQGAVLFLVWPIAVFLIVRGSYDIFGIIFGITLLASVLLKDVAAKAHEKSTLLAATHAASAWFVRAFIATPISVILIDTYSTGVPRSNMDIYTQELRADNGSYVDELTALKEMSLSLGRIVAMFVSITLLSITSYSLALPILFIFVAALSAYAVVRARESSI